MSDRTITITVDELKQKLTGSLMDWLQTAPDEQLEAMEVAVKTRRAELRGNGVGMTTKRRDQFVETLKERAADLWWEVFPDDGEHDYNDICGMLAMATSQIANELMPLLGSGEVQLTFQTPAGEVGAVVESG